MRKTASFMKFALAGAALAAFTGCNTVQGIGKDVQSAGKGIESGADSVRDTLTGNDKNDELKGGN